MISKLQYISQGRTNTEHLFNIKEVLDAGCNWIQLRIKNIEELKEISEKVKLTCDEYKATLIINDFIEIAKEINADGVHLGLEDGSVIKAREILGENKIIGGTANTLQDVRKRIDEKCDYIGLGPYKFTKTKSDLSPILGIDRLQLILNSLGENKIPIYAIGGIELNDVSQIISNTNIYGIAMSGSITKAINKKEYMKELKNLLNE